MAGPTGLHDRRAERVSAVGAPRRFQKQRFECLNQQVVPAEIDVLVGTKIKAHVKSQLVPFLQPTPVVVPAKGIRVHRTDNIDAARGIEAGYLFDELNGGRAEYGDPQIIELLFSWM